MNRQPLRIVILLAMVSLWAPSASSDVTRAQLLGTWTLDSLTDDEGRRFVVSRRADGTGWPLHMECMLEPDHRFRLALMDARAGEDVELEGRWSRQGAALTMKPDPDQGAAPIAVTAEGRQLRMKMKIRGRTMGVTLVRAH